MSNYDLSTKAVLIHLRVCRWDGTKRDAKQTDEVCKDLGVDEDAGYWVTNFIPPGKLDSLKTKAHNVRSIWLRFTRPWLDGGTRILPLKKKVEYDKEIGEAIAAYNAEAVRWVSEDYPVIVQKMPDRLKTLLNGRQMPSGEDLIRKFQIKVNVIQIARTSDLKDGPLADMAQEIERSLKQTASETIGSIYNQLSQLIAKIQKKLDDPKGKFKDSLINNLRAFCEELPDWNLTEDTALEDLRKEVVQKFGNADPQDLRDNPIFRKGAAKAAQALADKIASVRKIDLDL